MTLFIVKRGSYYPAAGLEQAARLTANGIGGSYTIVQDANEIDAKLAESAPWRVILEALWATPEKIDELRQIWPSTEFIVRVHSKIDFLSEEGIAFDWLRRYSCKVASNHRDTANYLSFLLARPVKYLPNLYPMPPKECGAYPGLNISCFGSSRPLKNQAVQAAAAILYAEGSGQRVIFHMNAADTQIMKSIRGMFRDPHTLVEHPWLPHDAFVRLAASMTIGMQVSLSETYNYVSADHIWQHTPVVCSPEMPWDYSGIQNLNSVGEVAEAIDNAVSDPHLAEKQLHSLVSLNSINRAFWV